MAICTNISLVKRISDGCDLLKVTIDNSIDAFWIYDFSDSNKYINQEVIVDYRQDMYEGKMERFINTFVVPTVVQTLDAQNDFKLYTDAIDNYSNVSFNDIQPGENSSSCILYCIKSEYKSSPKAVWHELTVRDRGMKVAKLRIFDYNVKDLHLDGKYIRCDIARNKYGFQTDMVTTIDGECPPNPEIELATQYLKNYFASNTAAQTFLKKYELFDNIKQHFDLEMGYSVVRLAMEVSMVNSMRNITNDINLDLLADAMLASYGYLARTSKLSPSVNNIVMSMSIPWNNKDNLMQLLDNNPECELKEVAIFKNIKNTVDTLLKIRKGVEDE